MLIFFKIGVFKNLFQEYHQSQTILDPDQARHFVGPYLGPNFLQTLSADNTRRQRVQSLLRYLNIKYKSY